MFYLWSKHADRLLYLALKCCISAGEKWYEPYCVWVWSRVHASLTQWISIIIINQTFTTPPVLQTSSSFPLVSYLHVNSFRSRSLGSTAFCILLWDIPTNFHYVNLETALPMYYLCFSFSLPLHFRSPRNLGLRFFSLCIGHWHLLA